MFNLKLGKLRPKINRKTLLFGKYASSTLEQTPPAKVYWGYKMGNDLRMFKNDTVGCCTVAGPGHLIMNMTAHQGKMIVPTDEQIIEAYSAVSGYNPELTDDDGNNSTDQGAAITDVLDYWQTQGIAGHKILGWVQFNHKSKLQSDLATWLFGGIDVGVDLPRLAMEQFDDGETWHPTQSDGGIEGGHCIVSGNYGKIGRKFVTWGKFQEATEDWISCYVDEAYAVISDDWFDTVGIAPNRFNKDELWKDLKALAA